MKDNIYALSSISEFANDGDPKDRIYIPGRGFVLASREGRSRSENLVILPDSEAMRQYTQDMTSIMQELQIRAPRPLFMPDEHYLLDINIANHLDHLRKELLLDMVYQVFPYTRTQELDQWVELLRQQGIDVRVDMPHRVYFDNLHHPQHRGGWSRHISDPQTLGFAEKYGIDYPSSFVGYNEAEVMEAYQRIVESSGNPRAILKPVFSSGGFTLRVVESLTDVHLFYQELKESGVLDLFEHVMPIEVQEMLPITDIFSIQYHNQINIAPNGLTRQLEHERHWAGNVFNSNHIAPEVRGQAALYFQRFVEGMQQETQEAMRGFGGLDFGLVNNQRHPRLVVLEHNGGREVGARPAIAFAQALGIADQPYLLRKVQGDPQSNLGEVWQMWQQFGLAYDSTTGEGAVPMAWFEGNVFFFVTGEDQKGHHNLLQMADQAIETTIREGHLRNVIE